MVILYFSRCGRKNDQIISRSRVIVTHKAMNLKIVGAIPASASKRGMIAHNIHTSVKSRVLVIISLFSLLLTLVGVVPALATVESDVSAINSNVNTMNQRVNSILGNIGSTTQVNSILYFLSRSNAFQTSTTISLGDIYSTLISIWGVLRPDSAGGIIRNQQTIISDFNSAVNSFFAPITSGVSDLVDFFVSDDHQALEDASADSVGEAETLISGNVGGKSTSQTASDFGGMSSSLGQYFDSSVSADDMFSIFSSGDTGMGDGTSVFDFFSNRAAMDMDANFSGSRSSDPAKNPQIVTDYYGDNQRAFDRLKGGNVR